MDTSETIANEDESVLKQFLDSEKGSKLDQTVGEFVSRLKRREFVNSYELAAQTVKTLTYLVRFVAGRKDATSIVLIQVRLVIFFPDCIFVSNQFLNTSASAP